MLFHTVGGAIFAVKYVGLVVFYLLAFRNILHTCSDFWFDVFFVLSGFFLVSILKIPEIDRIFTDSVCIC